MIPVRPAEGMTLANDKDFNIKQKKMQAIILMVIFFIPMCIALFFTGQYFNEKNEADEESLSTDVLSHIVSHMNTMSLSALNRYNSNLYERMNVRVSFLKEDVKNGRYEGQKVFSDGFVAELNGDEIIYPDGAPKGIMKVTPQLITTSIASGQMRTGRLNTLIYSDDTAQAAPGSSVSDTGADEDNSEADTDLTKANADSPETDPDSAQSDTDFIKANADSPQADTDDNAYMTEAEGLTQYNKEITDAVTKEMAEVFSDEISSFSEEDDFDKAIDNNAILSNFEYALSFAPITDKDIFVAVTSEQDFSDYVNLYTLDSLSALKNAADISNGMVFIISESGGNLDIIETYGQMDDLKDFSTSQITQDMLGEKKSDIIDLSGQRCRYVCVEADASFLNSESLYILQIFPTYSSDKQMFHQSLMICMLMLLIFTTLIVYTLSEQRFVVDNVMTKEEAIRYSPQKLRRKLGYAGVVGAISIFIFAFLTQTVGQLHQQIRNGEYTLQLLTGSIRDSIEDQTVQIQTYQEEWYVNCCTLISSYLSERPELATTEKLEELSRILEADYLMVFDSIGREYVSSNNYVGFTLSHGLGSDTTDFQSLLMGIPSIIHAPSVDKTTKQERQFIGVTMTAVDDPNAHGALVISLLPNQTNIAKSFVDVGDEMALTLNKENICFFANSETGEIIDSTQSSLEGRTIKECGLFSASLQDGYMDFGTIDNVDMFIITKTLGNKTFYYASQYLSSMHQNLLFSLLCILLYSVTLLFTVRGLLKNYNDTSYKKWITELLPNLPAMWKNQDTFESSVLGEEIKKTPLQLLRRRRRSAKPAKNKLSLTAIVSKFFNWESRLPEEKASLVFYVGMSLTMLSWIYMILVSEENVTLLRYLLYGDWKRGLNTFSLYCIILTIMIGNLIITISSWILYLFAGFLSSKGDTVCRLIRSIIKYITIIAMIFLSMSYIGLLNSTVIASVGLGSVILSLGAKDIVADILSGILIVFEQTLRIGDMVQYDGKTGLVQEVGMRTTKLELIPANDILEVRNHEIASVINMSKYVSNCFMELHIRNSESLDMIEKLLKDNLERIGKGCDEILSPPTYAGVTKLGSNAALIPLITISVGFTCNQKDYSKAYNYLNKELYLLFKENNISLY